MSMRLRKRFSAGHRQFHLADMQTRAHHDITRLSLAMQTRGMAMTDEDRPLKPPQHIIGQDLSELSIQEIERRVTLLTEEIERLTAARASKLASKATADLFFKRS